MEYQALVTINTQVTLAMGLFGEEFLTRSCRPHKLKVDLAGITHKPLVLLGFGH